MDTATLETPRRRRNGTAPTHDARPSRVERREMTLHGHRVAYRYGGEGPPLVFLHGIASSSLTWDAILPRLAARNTVLAPDLLGHGESAKPQGDYSLGAYAAGVRDLLSALGHDRATFVGHSLGGGVAMQLAYQFPQICERLVLVDSGGLGREVSALLRAATLPGSELVLPLLSSTGVLDVGRAVGRLLSGLGLRPSTDITELARGHASLADASARAAFVHTLRTIVEPGGQRVNASDRLYLARESPFMIVWGARDQIIPVTHALAAHELVPGSRLELFHDAGHFPHLDDPDRFIAVLADFLDTTEAASVDEAAWREMLRAGASGTA